MENKDTIFEINKCIDKIRPYIQRDGGDLEFVDFVDGYVYLKVHGACVGCMSLSYTISDGVEALLMDEVEGVEGVRLVNDEEFMEME